MPNFAGLIFLNWDYLLIHSYILWLSSFCPSSWRPVLAPDLLVPMEVWSPERGWLPITKWGKYLLYGSDSVFLISVFLIASFVKSHRLLLFNL